MRHGFVSRLLLAVLLFLSLVSPSFAGVPKAPASSSLLEDFDCSCVTEIPPEECEALVALRGWWCWENCRPSTWYGVTFEDGHVRGLSWDWAGIRGPLPAAIGNLTKLKFLDLSGNQITSLPPEIGNLQELVRLKRLL
jgi:Leucine-rich repeat (LRR) protein